MKLVTCKICEVRKPRRFCPGAGGDICAPCCGEQREVSIDCPHTCTYLQEARLHEKLPPVDPASFPNADVRVTDDFLRRHEPLFIVLSLALLQGAIESPGAVDSDVREAIESLIRTQRTAASGLVYETKPANLIAAGVQALFQEQLDEVKDRAAKQGASILDVEVLGMLVFLQRLAINHDNGRKYGRAFIDLLRTQFPGAKPKGEPDAGSLIVSA